MKNVLSYCLFDMRPENAKLFGNTTYYTEALQYNLLAARSLFPDWEILVYSDNSDKQNLLDPRVNAKAIPMGGRPVHDCLGMMWRWIPLFDKEVKYVASRDTDALMIPDERFALEEFIQIGGGVHNFSAHPQHNIRMMGGLSAVDAEQFRSRTPYKKFEEFISGYDFSKHGSDQEFIRTRIFDLLEDKSVEHKIIPVDSRPGYLSNKTKFFNRINYDLNPKMLIDKSLVKEANDLAISAGSIRFDKVKSRQFYEKHCFDNTNETVRTVFSSDINSTFDFFIPITAAFWKSLDFQPFVYLVGLKSEWEMKRSVILNLMNSKGFEYKFIDPVENVKTATIAQVIRLYAFCDLPNYSGYITTDVDMWPLAPKTFWQRSCSLKTWSFQGNHEFFMCYVSATKNTWKDLIGNTYGGSAREELIKQLSRGPGLCQTIPWEYDQILLTARINEWKGKRQEDRRIMGPNYLPDGRVDRYKWQFSKKQPHLKDCHVLRPGYIDENWSRLRILISEYLPNELKVLDKYREEYLKIVT